MNILIDINHPAHVHMFKNLWRELLERGHNVFITTKEIKSVKELLNKYNIPFINLGKKYDSIAGKLINQINYDFKLLKIVKNNRIHIGLGSSITVDHVSKISRMVSIHLSDDDAEVVPLVVKFGYPFTDIILSPDVVKIKNFEEKNILYSGYHELAYLYPKRFKPDPSVLKEAGINKREKFFIMRFNVFKAHHDIGARGLSLEQKFKLINVLKSHGRIFITTERDIEAELQKYQYKMSPEKIHHFLYYATMFLGDSQTMTSEAAVLGTPAIRCNTFVGQISYLEEEEHKYGLTYGFTPDKFDKMLEKIKELLKMPNLKQEWQKRRERMLKDKIDVTAFLVWFVENYPESAKIMRERPEYQYRFR